MVKPTIKYLFADKIERHRCPAWLKLLQDNKELYANCDVVTFTRVKNLDSDWKHEYVQFIVEDRDSGERTRVYAERANEKDLDYVTIGRDEKTFNAYPDLPLPISSLTFGGKGGGITERRKPSVIEIAKVLSDVSDKGGAYNLKGNNCFWFAFTSFAVVQACFTGDAKVWQWVNPGGRGGGGVSLVKDVWSLGFSTLFKFAFKSNAEKFKAEREDFMTWSVGETRRQEVTPEQVVKSVVKRLEDPGELAEYIAAMQALGIEADSASVKHVAAAVVKNATQVSLQPEIKWTEEFDAEVNDFTHKVLADASRDKFLKQFSAADEAQTEKPVDGDDLIPLSTLQTGPNHDVASQLEEALKAFVGGVIAMNKLEGVNI